jgi:quinol monooxygenase YgiN
MMSDQIVYVDRFQIRQGKQEEFRRYAEELAGLAKGKEPGVLSDTYFIDEDGAQGTAVVVFSDATALDRYLDLVSPKFREGVDLLSSTEIELLGDPSDRAVEMAKAFGGSVKRKLVGFGR